MPLREAFWQDAVFGVRMLRRRPGFTCVALVALALGIGANTAIFSIVDAVLWRPLPFGGERRVLEIAEQRPRESRWFGPVSPADFFDWQRDSRSFTAMAAYSPATVNLTGVGEPERLRGLTATSRFFDVLAIAPAYGRVFQRDEETVGRHRVAILTDGLWRRRFGADPAIVGRTAIFDGRPYEVVGVLPPSFWWPSHPDVVMPLALSDSDRALRDAHFLWAIARVKDDVSPARAHEDLAAIGQRLAREFPVQNARHFPNTRPIRDALVGDMRSALMVLLGAVGFVLLIACANVATLLLARAASRRKELAVRRAMGAARARLARQVLTESLIVALAGGAAGLLVASWSLAALRSIVPARFTDLPGIERVGIDARVAGVAFVLTLVTGLLFGTAPAVVASDERTASALNDESRTSSGTSRASRLRSMLVASEIALSFVLLTGAGLLLVSFDRLANVQPGFRAEQVSTMWLTLPGARYSGHQRAAAFYDALLERLSSMPGLQGAAATTALPLSDGLGDARLDLAIENRVLDLPEPVRAHPRLIAPGYFLTMGIPLLRGRSFDRRDRAGSTAVVIINDTAARRYWAGENPIGHRINLGGRVNWLQIVGVVGDVRYGGLDVEAEPEAYIPLAQGFTELGTGFGRTMAVVVRTSDSAGIAAALRTAVRESDPQQPVGTVRPMDDLIVQSVAPRRLNSMLLTMFAAVAVVLTTAGLFGVMSCLLAQRTREIGVRMALGATRRQVMTMMFREAGAITASGLAIGAAGAFLLTRSMSSLLFGVTAADPIVYGAVAGLLALAAVLAVAVPSSRATRIDPLAALRES
jgi:putative ABC transport system permease protein